MTDRTATFSIDDDYNSTDDLAAEGDRLHAAVVWLLNREPFTAEHGDDPCNRCGHGAWFHRLDDAVNVAPDDPKAQFRCIWPLPDGPAVRLCTCPDHIAAVEARHD